MLLFSLSYGASFDCRKASTEVEHLICGDRELSQLDEQLLVAYKHAKNRNNPERTKLQQRRWLKYTRNDCNSVACLKNAYTLQIERLNAQNTLRSHSKWSGSYALDGDELRIENSLHFSYNSVGGNGHLCNIEGKLNKVLGKLQFHDNANDCHLSIEYLDPSSLRLDISICQYYCGMSAMTTSGTYIKK